MDSVSTKKINVLDMVYVAVGVVLLAVCSWITIPMTVPFTLQTFAAFAVLLLLGGERGTISILIYVLMGAVGLPVFSGFTGGLGVLFGKTGGYILGFILIGMIYLFATKMFGRKSYVEIIALTIGLAGCYLFGTGWFMFIYLRDTGDVGLLTVLSWCVFPFIIPDLAKMALAFLVAKRVRPVIKQ